MKKKHIVLIVLGVLLGLFLFFTFPIFLNKFFGIQAGTLGTYGDFFGSFNALVSLLAFGGLLYTVRQQSEELKLQRTELELTREELKRQAAAQEKTAKEQEHHAKLLEEQLYKEIRPYINAYLTFEDHVFIIIKNIGKSACNDFSMKIIKYHTDSEENDLLLEKTQINFDCISFSIIPPGLEFVVPLNITRNDVKEKLLQSSITIEFSFYYRGKKEKFTIPFNFGELQTHSDSITRGLFTINKQIYNTTAELNRIRQEINKLQKK